jgi:hypothetical protein
MNHRKHIFREVFPWITFRPSSAQVPPKFLFSAFPIFTFLEESETWVVCEWN